VALSAVVGIPDPVRTEAVKAWIVLRPGFAPNEKLAREIQDFVKVQLAAHEYPRHVEFADSLPMTATGKVAAGIEGEGVGVSIRHCEER
jgi:acetyl-CoA synthetase